MEVPGRVAWEGTVTGRPLGPWLISEMLYRVVISKPCCVKVRYEEEALISDHRLR